MDYTRSQEDAINIIDRNLQIIACAGSGKTHVVAKRVVNTHRLNKAMQSSGNRAYQRGVTRRASVVRDRYNMECKACSFARAAVVSMTAAARKTTEQSKAGGAGIELAPSCANTYHVNYAKRSLQNLHSRAGSSISVGRYIFHYRRYISEEAFHCFVDAQILLVRNADRRFKSLPLDTDSLGCA